MKPSKLIEFLFVILSLVIWFSIVGAKYAPYDTNYFLLSCGFLLSFLTTFTIISFWIFKRDTIKGSALAFTLFLVTTSPLSLYLFLEFTGMEMKK
jgi:hypothetical protein